MGFIKFTQIRWCRGAIAEGAAPTLALALWKRPMLVGWHEPTECMTLGKFTGSALRNNKNVISDVFGSGNHLPTTQLSWAWMEPRRPNVELEVPWQLMFMGRSPGEHPRMPIRPCWRYDKGIMVVRLPQKKKNIINGSQNRTISIPSFPEFTSVKLQNLVGKPSNAPPTQLSASNSSPGQRKNSNFAWKNGTC